MRESRELRPLLRRLDGRGYRAYRELSGTWDYGAFLLFVDHVQGDPYASPSHLRLELSLEAMGILPPMFSGGARQRACEDFLLRCCHEGTVGRFAGSWGTGRSGEIRFQSLGQEVLERNGAVLSEVGLDLRFFLGLPGHGRRLAGREASRLLLEELPHFVEEALLAPSVDLDAMAKHADCVEDQVALRRELSERGLVSFVANGSHLPRASGIDDRPLEGGSVVSFQSPLELSVSLTTPHGGKLEGMGIPRGVTLIVGGGYHGKSTLLRAVERGIWDHVPGDGRERVVTVEDAAKVRSEDGRSVASVDVSNFIDNLPSGMDTRAFRTENASGSTSQAANIVEALEVGTSLLLLDEDSSANNFMIRDPWMRRLVPDDREPITPFVDKVRALHRERGVSTLLVVGGAGETFTVADRVIMLDSYRLRDVTAAAAELSEEMKTQRSPRKDLSFEPYRERRIDLRCIDPQKGKKRVFVRERGGSCLCLGTKEIDLSQVEQVVDPDQILAIGHALAKLRQCPQTEMVMTDLLNWIDAEIYAEGLDALNPWPGRHPGTFMSRPRPLEIAGALNRLRGLRVAKPR